MFTMFDIERRMIESLDCMNESINKNMPNKFHKSIMISQSDSFRYSQRLKLLLNFSKEKIALIG